MVPSHLAVARKILFNWETFVPRKSLKKEHKAVKRRNAISIDELAN